MKIVLDTNILVSALIKAGKPRELLFRIVEDRTQLVVSRGIIQELLDVAEDPRIRRYVDEGDLVSFLRVLGSIAKMVRVRSRFKVVKDDPDDDIILRTAHDSRADYVASGNEHLLAIREFRGIRILTVNEMLNLLEEERRQKDCE